MKNPVHFVSTQRLQNQPILAWPFSDIGCSGDKTFTEFFDLKVQASMYVVKQTRIWFFQATTFHKSTLC